jgi:hypothetical protein
MSDQHFTVIRRVICSSLEELGGVNTRMREIEEGTSFDGAEEEIEQWLFDAADQLEKLAERVRAWRAEK